MHELQLTVRLQESSDPGPEPIVLDRLGVRLWHLTQLFPLLLALLDELLVLLLGSAVLLDDLAQCTGQVRQNRPDVTFGIRCVANLGLERMELDRVLDDYNMSVS